MNLNGLQMLRQQQQQQQQQQQLHQLHQHRSWDDNTMETAPKKKSSLFYRRSLRASTSSTGSSTSSSTSSSGRHRTASVSTMAKPKLSTSLVDYSDPQRTLITLEKQDNETFGFEIQTYGLQLRNSSAVEMCTFVRRVEEESAAESAGLTAGDVIISINGASIEGWSHQRVLDLIRESTNSLKMETVCGSVVKWIELEKRMNMLKQTLSEKVAELRALTLQEQRLTGGNLNELPLDFACSPGLPHARRFSSSSSFWSVMTEDSDGASVFGDAGSPGPLGPLGSLGPLSAPGSASSEHCFFSRDFPGSRLWSGSGGAPQRPSLARSSSSGLTGSSNSLSSGREETRISSLFGTLPRKGRRASVRKNILKLIPGLQRSVEEEDADT